ncbi:hypothetical protein [Actinobacillus suis]|nr:hypothetical protein [Actinobacillus suis]
MGWYMYQMALISQGKASKPQYSAWWILLKMLFTQGFRRERA